ncbi:MAG: hypothetical protein P8Y94_03125, partial [Acidobacteriota bacterium]
MLSQVSALRSTYESERKRLDETFLYHGDVDRYLDEHSDLVDEIIRALYEPLLGQHEICVLATAGYGRREQFPQSDVDLLVVHDFQDDSRAEQIIAPFLNNLWDTRLALGHQVWRLDQLERLTLDDFEFILALFNGRVVTGSQVMGKEVLERILPAFIEAHRDQLVEQVVAATRRRHEKFSNTIYQLEPDLKEAPGGLRDHLAASWLERLVGSPPFLLYSGSEIGVAHRFLKRLRILVHLQNQRPDNRLTHSIQEQLLPHLGYGGMKIQAGVESLMKEYFLNARVISGLCSALLRLAQPSASERPLEPDELPPFDSISEVLEAFRISLDEERPLSPATRRAVLKSLPKVSESISFPALRDPLKDLFRPRSGLYRVLSDFYELGVLELLFPEFGTIKARVIRDFYHKYTVDEHTLIAIKCIEDLAGTQETADARFGTILRDTVAPCHLTLSLLLHDVGKSRGGKHTDASARMARRALRRFRFEIGQESDDLGEEALAIGSRDAELVVAAPPLQHAFHRVRGTDPGGHAKVLVNLSGSRLAQITSGKAFQEAFELEWIEVRFETANQTLADVLLLDPLLPIFERQLPVSLEIELPEQVLLPVVQSPRRDGFDVGIGQQGQQAQSLGIPDQIRESADDLVVIDIPPEDDGRHGQMLSDEEDDGFD